MTNLQRLGCSRTCLRSDHLFQAPDSFVRAPLPGMRQATAIIHVGPALGAGFTEYTAELQTGGTLGSTNAQRFFYVSAGVVEFGESTIATGGFAFTPEGDPVEVKANCESRLIVIEKPWQPAEQEPHRFTGSTTNVNQQPLLGDEGVMVQPLVPDSPAFDFAVNLMTFAPGASLSMLESHIMEHGLMMLEGGGIYRLGDGWYPIAAGDFIWMAPYCPQWFGAIGKGAAKYLIYKDWNRRPV